MLVGNESEFSTTVCTAVLILCHEILVYSNAQSYQVSNANCREVSAELTFCNEGLFDDFVSPRLVRGSEPIGVSRKPRPAIGSRAAVPEIAVRRILVAAGRLTRLAGQ